jgi:hypothetical protein
MRLKSVVISNILQITTESIYFFAFMSLSINVYQVKFISSGNGQLTTDNFYFLQEK